MIVFKTYWQIVKKYKGTIILYTIMLIIFGGMNASSNNQTTTFTASKPDILIVNNDENIGLTANLIKYLENNSNIIKVKNSEEARDDALFYRDINYIIYIPNGYRKDILNGLNPKIDIKSTKDYMSSLTEMMLSRYLKTQSIYAKTTNNESNLIESINQSLDKKSSIEVTSKIDTNTENKVSGYFNFASYSIMAVVIYIICLVLSSFHEKYIRKRTIISSMNYKTHNKYILLASFIYTCIVWLLYILLGIFLFKGDLFTIKGLIYSINTFIFTFCSLTIALLISTIVSSKEAISGIVNVIALGSAFLCGAFIPAEWLPSSILTVAHVLPAYWYINSNDILSAIEVINLSNMLPILINMLVIVILSIIFILINNFIAKRKRVIS